MEKWDVENNIELIIEAIRRGYIELEADQIDQKAVSLNYQNEKHKNGNDNKTRSQ